jgi:hypothetical protein
VDGVRRRREDGLRREDWLGVWVNELHGDYLAYERLAEARARAARTALIVAGRPSTRSWLGARLARMLTAIRRSA